MAANRLYCSLVVLIIILAGKGAAETRLEKHLVREKRAFSFDDFLDNAVDSLSNNIDEEVDDILGGLGLDKETIDDVKDAVDDVIGKLDDELDDVTDAAGNTTIDDVTEKVNDVIDAITNGRMNVDDVVQIITNAIGNSSTNNINNLFGEIISQFSEYEQNVINVDALFDSSTLIDVRDAINNILNRANPDLPVEIPELPPAFGNALSNLTLNEVLIVIDDILGTLILSNGVSSPEVDLSNGTNSQTLYLVGRIVVRLQTINQAIDNFTQARLTEAFKRNGLNVTSDSRKRLVPTLVMIVRSQLQSIRQAILSELQSILETIFSFSRSDQDNNIYGTTPRSDPDTSNREVNSKETENLSAKQLRSNANRAKPQEDNMNTRESQSIFVPTQSPELETSPLSKRRLGELLSRFQQIRQTMGTLMNGSNNETGTTGFGRLFHGRISSAVRTVQNRLQETQELIESRIREFFTSTISSIRARDNPFLERFFRNKTDEEISSILTQNLQDVIPLLVRISLGQATIDDVKCVLVDNILRQRMSDAFENELTTRIVSNLLLTLAGCDSGLNPLGNVLDNPVQVSTGVQAMTSLTESRELEDIAVVDDVREALSNINPLFTAVRVFTEQLTNFLNQLRNLISQLFRRETTSMRTTPSVSTISTSKMTTTGATSPSHTGTRTPSFTSTTLDIRTETTVPTRTTTATPFADTFPFTATSRPTTVTATTTKITTYTTTSTTAERTYTPTTPATETTTGGEKTTSASYLTITSTPVPSKSTTPKSNSTTVTDVEGRRLGLLISCVLRLSRAFQNFTQIRLNASLQNQGVNMTTGEGTIINELIPNIIRIVRSQIQDIAETFESILQGMLTDIISSVRSNDNIFLQNVFGNVSDTEIAAELTKRVQDLIPLMVKIASGQADLNDVRCVLADYALRTQLNSTFREENTRDVVSSLLLTIVGCDAKLNAGGEVLTNITKVTESIQAMTALTSFIEESDADPVEIIRDTLSNLDPLLVDAGVFSDRLSSLTHLLRSLISGASAPPTSESSSRTAARPNPLVALLGRGSNNNIDLGSSFRSIFSSAESQSQSKTEERISRLLQSAIASTSLNKAQAQIISNQVASLVAPMVVSFVNSTLSNVPNEVQAFGALLEQVDLNNPSTVVNAISGLANILNEENSTLSNIFPPSVTQLLNQGGSSLQSLSSLMVIPEAMMALGQIYSDGYNTSGRCQLERSAVGNALESMEPWALLFVDAMGKLGTGVLQGNTYLVGNFDQCETISGRTEQGDVIEANYVKYKFRIPLPLGIPSMNGFIGSQESGLPIVIWGLCLPKGCSQSDAKVIGDGVAAGLNIAHVSAEIITARDPMGDSVFVIAMFIFGTLGLFCIIGTFLDVIINNQSNRSENETSSKRNSNGRFFSKVVEEVMSYRSPTGERPINGTSFRDLRLQLGTMESRSSDVNQDQNDPTKHYNGKTSAMLKNFFQAFSVYKNAQDIWSAHHAPGDLACLHGIRVASITWVILGHSYFFYPQFGNFSTYLDMTKWWTFHGILNALLAVDSFFLLSGCLVAYLFLRSVKKAGGLKAKHMVLYYTHRYLRLTPLYAVAILFYTGVTPYLEYGPFQRDIPDRDQYCRDNWYWNLLYINNLREDTKFCLGWSWYLPNDMQFYIVAPLVLMPMALGYKYIGFLVAFLQFACHVVAFTLLEDKYNGTATRNALEYFIYIYIKPYTRCAPYAVGLVLGYVLYKTKCNVSLNRLTVFIGWVLALGGGLTVVFITVDNYSSDLGAVDPKWSQGMMNAYEIACKPVWALCLAWLVFACSTGHGGVINSILSWKAWIPLSRLTYGVYLCHVMVMHYFNNNRRTLAYLTKEHVIERYMATIVLSYALSFVLSLLIETPVRNLTKPTPIKPKAKPRNTPTLGMRRRRRSLSPTGSQRQNKSVTFSGDVNVINNDYNSIPRTPPSITRPTAPHTEETSPLQRSDTTAPPAGYPDTATTSTAQEITFNAARLFRTPTTGPQEADSSHVPNQMNEPEHSRASMYPNLAYVEDKNDWLASALGHNQQSEPEISIPDQPMSSTST